jgi:DNA-binding MarR family transcriptional regulator
MSDKSKSKKHNVHGAGLLLWKAANAWQRHVRDQLKPLGITHVQFLLLEATQQLEAGGKQPSQILLARTAGTDVMMTSKVIRLLEKEKLVARKSNRKDARSVTLQLTAEGKKKLVKATTAMQRAEISFFSKLKSKPHKFVANLEGLSEEAH